MSDDTEYQRWMRAGGTANDFITQRINNGLCPICDWPMADSQERGCIPGDCCYRPDDPAEHRRIRERRAALKSHSGADAMSDDTDIRHRCFMDGIDWQHHLSGDAYGTELFPCEESLREKKTCITTGGCGVVEVEVRLIRWVEPQNLIFPPEPSEG